AWSPLLKSYHQNIETKVDGWRGTLDTLLIFVALFSAIVTSFLVQSLSGLTEDDGQRTNELLANLTEVVVALGAGTPASQLDLPRPVQFVPDRGAVRLNVYWSISLIFSVRFMVNMGETAHELIFILSIDFCSLARCYK
ncbi:uncharacterized protein STEHIDRAFT_52025, partial [Stereum hirsutum FP-91666 SS1]|uniref:uncharacterized protein n=1 Tax=Stereum hirsutum (strain FP-91666) TaxID=721885 RepID=UPI000440CEF3